jgi:Cft2 family RNA processing exonuclease
MDHEAIDVNSCQCRSLATIRIDHGLSPTTPNQPRLAISVDFLELYHALFEHTGYAVMATSAALNKLYTWRGYPINTEEVSRIINSNIST